MQTDDLIAQLAGDRRSSSSMLRLLALAIVASLVGSFLVMMLGGWGMRPDLHQAMRTGPFWMKAGYSIAFAVAGVALIERLGRPGGRGRVGWMVLALAVAAIVALAVAELASMPMAGWHADMMGHSSQICALSITLISAPAFAAIVWMLRRMAPTRPHLAGIAAGLLASGLGATVYGLFCQETGAAFTAIWYTSAMLIWPAIGALVGGRLLRW
ncbi:MAG TPA: DUF1109 domain-containing protein [Caulobacteraceae bacterium]|jgi:hypothetical protein|nr:DUF1109 domain-containing protein [Caulobacteraceae bacterium]